MKIKSNLDFFLNSYIHIYNGYFSPFSHFKYTEVVNIYITSTTNSLMCSLNRSHGITSQFIKSFKNLIPSTNKTPEWQFKGRNQWHTFKNTVTFSILQMHNAFLDMLKRALNAYLLCILINFSFLQ